MQGLAVVPLFAGFDLHADQGRIFSYDVTGGRYEETAFHSVGSGSLFARGSLKKLYREDLTRARVRHRRRPGALRRRRRRLGHRRSRPDPAHLPGGRRGHRRRATAGCRTPRSPRRRPRDLGAHGTPRRSRGVADVTRPSSPTQHAGSTPMSMPFYVSPEQLMKDRADFARKGIARGRSVAVVQYADGILFVARTRPRRCTRSARSTTGSRSPRSGATTSSRTCASPASAWPTCAATPTTAATSPAGAWPTRTPRRSARSSPPAARSRTRWRSSSPRSATRADDDQIYRLTYDGQVADEHGFAAMGGSADLGRRVPRGALPRAAAADGRPADRGRRTGAQRPPARAPAPSRRTASRSPCSTAPAPSSASSGGSRRSGCASCSGSPPRPVPTPRGPVRVRLRRPPSTRPRPTRPPRRRRPHRPHRHPSETPSDPEPPTAPPIA